MPDSIQFPFNLLATIQTAGMWLNLYDHDLPWQYLAYLLYLSDREHLIRSGSPITGDVYVCVNNKPNLLTINELIHHRFVGDFLGQSNLLWQNYFTAPNEQGEVSLLKQAGDDELSSSIEDVVQYLFDLHRNYTLSELENWTSGLAECRGDNYPRSIQVCEILARNGYVIEDLIEIKNTADRQAMFAKISDDN